MRFISYHVQINYTCINEQLEVSPFAPQGEGSAAWAVALKYFMLFLYICFHSIFVGKIVASLMSSLSGSAQLSSESYLKAILHFSSYIGSRSPQQELVCMSESAFPLDLGLFTVFFRLPSSYHLKNDCFFCRLPAMLQGRVKCKVQNHYYSGTSNPRC